MTTAEKMDEVLKELQTGCYTEEELRDMYRAMKAARVIVLEAIVEFGEEGS